MSSVRNKNGTINRAAAIRTLEEQLAWARRRVAELGDAPAAIHWRRKVAAFEWAIQVCRLYVEGGGS